MQIKDIQKYIKPADIILIILIALAAVILSVIITSYDSYKVKGSEEKGKKLVIYADGEIEESYPLNEDRVIEIGESNVCEIKGGEVKMISADCPDQSCVRSKAISGHGETIVCLPNKIILQIKEADTAHPDEGPDTVTY